MALLGVAGQHRPPAYAVVDLETTGLDPARDRIVECAVLGLDERAGVVEEWDSVVAIGGADPIGASFLHGLTATALAGAPRFADLLDELVARLRGRTVVGHVLAFDLAFLAAECARAGYRLPDLSCVGICTRELARRHLPGDSYSLGACCRRVGVAHARAHTALGDARATAALLAHLLARGADRPSPDRARHLTWAPPPAPRDAPRSRPRELASFPGAAGLR